MFPSIKNVKSASEESRSTTSTSELLSESRRAPKLRSKKKYIEDSAIVGTPIFKIEASSNALLAERDDNKIHHIALYNPIQKGCKKLLGDAYSPAKEFTGLLRQLKNSNGNEDEKQNESVICFSTLLSQLVTDGNSSERIVVCSVPTSTPEKVHKHGATLIAKNLARSNNHIDGTLFVYRRIAKKACHKGGSRDPNDVVAGLEIVETQITGKTILLLDDIVSTGTNMHELFKLLRFYGAKRIVCLALGCSINDLNINTNRKSVLEEMILNEVVNIEKDPKKLEMFKDLSDSIRKAFPLSPVENLFQSSYVPFLQAKRRTDAKSLVKALEFTSSSSTFPELVTNISQTNTDFESVASNVNSTFQLSEDSIQQALSVGRYNSFPELCLTPHIARTTRSYSDLNRKFIDTDSVLSDKDIEDIHTFNDDDLTFDLIDILDPKDSPDLKRKREADNTTNTKKIRLY